MIELGKVADATGGTVAIVNAAMLGHRMMDLLNEAFVATHVEATLIAPKELFWYEDIELQTPLVSQHTPQRSAGTSGNGEREKISRLQKTIGNVFRESDSHRVGGHISLEILIMKRRRDRMQLSAGCGVL